MKVEDVNKTDFSKIEFKEIINKAGKKEDTLWLRNEMEGKTKTKDLVTVDCYTQPYFKEKSLSTTRELFRIRTNMNEIKGNFKNDTKYKNSGVMCVACGMAEEVNSHVMVCPEYEDLRQGRDFSKNQDLVSYFRKVMTRRETISGN